MITRLTPSQAAAFGQRISPMLRFLGRCRKRLDAAGYDPKCALYTAVSKAHDAVFALSVELHYQSIGRGVGRPSDGE
jgi:hypothetical protein